MSSDPIVTSRQPIENLRLDENEETLPLSEKFDMYREILTNYMKDAIGFGYLEHMFRISTDTSSYLPVIRKTSAETRVKLQEIVEVKNQILQGCIHMLDTRINAGDIEKIDPNIMNINHKISNKRLAVEENQFGEGENLPVCYTLYLNNKYYLLYTPNMTFLDGFDPYSGQTKIPLLTQDMIKNLSKDFYQRVTTKAIQTESEVFKRVQKKKTTSRASANPAAGIFSFVSNKPNEEESKEINVSDFDFTPKPGGFVAFEEKKVESDKENEEEGDEKYEEMNNIKEINEENQSKSDKSSENEEDGEQDDDSNLEEDFEFKPPKQPGERTWERFQKKAVEKQKERDQCGPGDCIII